jgi:hypothetical protein
LAVLLCLFGLASETQGATWQSRQLPIGEPIRSAIDGISCPSTNLCVAAAESDAIAWTKKPIGGAGQWQIVRPYDVTAEGDNANAICTEPNDPTKIIECPKEVPIYRKVRAISCPSTGVCVAVTYDGYVYSSTDPTGPASSWKVVDVDGTGRDTHLESISCPEAGFCVAVSGNRYTSGKVLSSSNPTGPSSAWQVIQLEGEPDLRGVSCISRSLCVAVGAEGRVFASSNPDGGPAAWNSIGSPGGPGALEAISCLSEGTSFCLGGNAGGNLLTTASPTGPASAWDEVNGGGSVQITGASCATTNRCIAVDNNGAVLSSTQPATGPWSRHTLVPYTPTPHGTLPENALFAADCPTTSFCIAAGAAGRVFTSTDPFASPSTGGGPGQPGRHHRHRRLRSQTVLKEADRFHNLVGRRRHFHASFRFHAVGPVRGFECKRDRGPYRRCRSPLRYWVGLGLHHLRVRAIGVTGLRGPVAKAQFRVIANLLPGHPGS